MWKHELFGIKMEVHGIGRDNDGLEDHTVISLPNTSTVLQSFTVSTV
jgi:hypothetical protein